MKSIFRFFAERTKLATLITIMILMLGINTLFSIKRAIYPNVDFGIMNIKTLYPGASPEDVELNVTNKIEEELKTVVGIDNFTSYSMENVSFILVTLDIDADDMDKTVSEVREAVGRVTDFPDEVTDSPEITEWDSSIMEIIEVGITGDVPYRDLRAQSKLLEKKLKDIPGVSHLSKYGYRAREVKVEISPEAVKKYQVPLREIIGAIQARNIHGSAGTFESYTSEQELVTLSQFENPSEVNEVIVRSTFEGQKIKVSDLGRVRDGFEDERLLSRMNGVDAISFLVFLEEKADAIRACDDVKQLVVEENERHNGKFEVVYTNDTSIVVANSFRVVLLNGLLGLILAVLLLPIFLNLRTAFWVALGIPVTMMGAIFLMKAFGYFLDTIALSGLVLVIGIVVDDAIIIAENIYSRAEKGDAPLDAAANGIAEVYQPVLTTILTTFLVFAPMFFMSGTFGKFIFVIPLAISLALFVSLAEVTIALPAHLMGGLKHSRGKASRSWFIPVKKHFQRLLLKSLKLRYLFMFFAILALSASFWYAGNSIKFILFPSDTAQKFYVLVEMPTGTSLKKTSEKIKELEELIMELSDKELASFNTRIGTNVQINAESENYGAIQVILTPYDLRDRTADQIVEEVRVKSEKLAGFKSIKYDIDTGGPPVGKPINLRITGSNDELRTLLADSVEAFLATIDGVKDITRDDQDGKEQVLIDIDYDQLSRLGLTVADVAQNVRIAYDGEIVTSVRYGDEDVDFRLILDEKSRKKRSTLANLPIPNRQGRLIDLNQIAKLSPGPFSTDFRHYDGDRTITIKSDLNQDITVPLEVTDAVLAHFDLDKDWPGTSLGLGGEIVETDESMNSLMRTMVIAVIAIYFLLVILFNSFSQPLLVMIAIPFGLIGVIIAFGVHGEPFSFVGMMGIIGLSGVVVNDSLVLVNHINSLRKKDEKLSIKEVVSLGTANRLRAVLMTTMTTVVALLPLAYGVGGTATFMAPMALALGWGLFLATPLTLIMIPSLYVIGDDLSRLISYMFAPFKRKEIKSAE